MDIGSTVPSLGGGSGARQLTGLDAEVEGPISADELFHVLQNPRRRAVIQYLNGREAPVEMSDVVEHVAAWEEDTTVEELHSAKRRRVYASLYQHHIETLVSAGLIKYDKSRRAILPQPLLDDVATYLEQEQPDTDTTSHLWSLGYLGISLVAILLLIGIMLELTVVEPLSELAVMGFILLLFIVLTIAKTIFDG